MSALQEIAKKEIRDMTEIEYCLYRVSTVNVHCQDSAVIAAEDLAKKDAAIAALRERVAKLEEAIKPFAEIPCLENFDDDQLFDPAGGVLAGDVRKARAALRGEA